MNESRLMYCMMLFQNSLLNTGEVKGKVFSLSHCLSGCLVWNTCHVRLQLERHDNTCLKLGSHPDTKTIRFYSIRITLSYQQLPVTSYLFLFYPFFFVFGNIYPVPYCHISYTVILSYPVCPVILSYPILLI